MGRIDIALNHFVPSLIGWLRLAFQEPLFASRLLVLRAGFFLTRRLLFDLEDPRHYRITNHHMLISYWAFFVEEDLSMKEWGKEFQQAESPIAIDVGANGGVFTHLLLTLNPKAKIYAYEPLPHMAKPITEYMQRSKANIVFHNAACSDTTGATTLYCGEEGDTDASLISETRESKAKVTVSQVTLDATVLGGVNK